MPTREVRRTAVERKQPIVKGGQASTAISSGPLLDLAYGPAVLSAAGVAAAVLILLSALSTLLLGFAIVGIAAFAGLWVVALAIRTEFNARIAVELSRDREIEALQAIEMLARDHRPDRINALRLIGQLQITSGVVANYLRDCLVGFIRQRTSSDSNSDREEVQRAVSALGHVLHSATDDTVELADLTDVNLKGIDLARSYLVGIDFSESSLQNANLIHADLTGAVLRATNLSGANLTGATLRGADLGSAVLDDALVADADLAGAGLVGAKLIRTDLHRANLSSTYLSDATLWHARLVDTNMTGATLVRADLNDADLTRAKLRDADLHGAQLQGARIDRSQLRTARYDPQDIEGAVIRSEAES